MKYRVDYWCLCGSRRVVLTREGSGGYKGVSARRLAFAVRFDRIRYRVQRAMPIKNSAIREPELGSPLRGCSKS